MKPPRKSAEVVEELLSAMVKTVCTYHPTVGHTSSTGNGLIQGTAFFPGGAGLWRGASNGGGLPEYFPAAPLMFVGHNFDSERGYATSLSRRGEVEAPFWIRLLGMLEAASLQPEGCFFTIALMGLKPGKAEGPMPSLPGYKDESQRFLQRQFEIVRPCAVVALGSDAVPFVHQLNCRFVTLKHPSNWDFRPLATQGALLRAEGDKLREFLNSFKSNDATENELWTSLESKRKVEIRTEAINDARLPTQNNESDAWGFRLGSRSSFLMAAIERGGKSKREIKIEFDKAFPNSAGKSTFDVFFSDVGRPFGSANASRCIPIPVGESVAIYLDPARVLAIKQAVAGGMLKEINPLEGGRFPKRFRRDVDSIVGRFQAPLTLNLPD